MPAVLLSLGALCLLVAAVAFLAVAWSWLGVGGRTAVLVVLTATAAVAGSVLARRGLRVAAESLTVVGAGLWILDIIGADRAGWLGELSPTALTGTVGIALAAYGVVTLVAARRLAVPQVTVPVGLLVFVLALADQVGRPEVVAACAVPSLAALVLGGRRTGLAVLPWSAGVAASCTWLWLVGLGLDALAGLPTLSWSSLWVDGPGWTLAVAALLVMLPLAVAPRSDALVLTCGAATTTAATALALVPALDGPATMLGVVALAATLGWLLAGHLLTASRPAFALIATVPAALLALPLAGIATTLLAIAGERVVPGGSAPRLPVAVLPVHQLLLVPCALAVVAVIHLAVLLLAAPHLSAGRGRLGSPRAWAVAAAGVGGVASVATVALYAVPVWAVLLLVVATAAAAAAAAVSQNDAAGLATMLASVGALLLAVAIAVPDPGRLTVVTAVLLLVALVTLLRGRFPLADELGGALLPAAAAGLLWAVAAMYDAHDSALGVPTLLLVGGIALVLPRVTVEASAALAGLMAAPIAIIGSDHLATSTALHLTVAGALVTASSLIHPSRRPLGLLGGALLLLATWVRLADLGVTTPEAYTVPAALVLVGLGLLRMFRDDAASSATSLAPGLTLLTVPSLLWILASDPVSWRALLLGVGCLALVLGGALVRWSAPLTIGAAVGAVLALTELAPYVAQTPQWVVLGTAGALLTGVGVTWEKRMADVRHASEALGRLR